MAEPESPLVEGPAQPVLQPVLYPPPHPSTYPPPHPGGYGPYPQAPYYPPPGGPVAPYGGWVAPPPGPAPGLAYAGFWVRFGAHVIDWFAIGTPLSIIMIVALGSVFSSISCNYANFGNGQFSGCTIPGSAFTGLTIFWLLWLLVPAIYFIAMWALAGRTFGQMALGLYVVDAANGQKISVGRSLLRYFGFLISSWALLIGLIWAAFDPRKQGWHDKIANTFVVRRV
jgi:uncharacterized RDD family membrane protein YckC